jgi:transcriptional regulator with XRE-family HTH domain
LRREDVAELAGLSIGWYARLELGQIENVAPRTLAAVAKALQLDSHETEYLFTLSRTPLPQFEEHDDNDVPTHFRVLVERFTSGSAALIGPRCDVLLSNAIARRVGLSSFGQGLERNAAWQIFTRPSFQERVVDWDAMGRLIAGYLREGYARHIGDPAFEELIETLHAESPLFARYWDERVVSPPSESTLRVRVPDGGIVELARTTTALIEAPGHYLWFLVPLDPNDLRRLTAE